MGQLVLYLSTSILTTTLPKNRVLGSFGGQEFNITCDGIDYEFINHPSILLYRKNRFRKSALSNGLQIVTMRGIVGGCIHSTEIGQMTRQLKGILVTGGGTFLGDNIASALLAEGAEVTLLVRPGTEDRLGPLAQRARWYLADVWDPASLRGRARNHAVVIHTVGSMTADPAQGLSHHRLNFLSARNVANMCVSDGVPHMVLLSSVSAPWVNREYIRSKREAESYLRRVGLSSTIIRAPLTYVRGRPRPLFYQLMTLLGSIPPLSWFIFGRVAPMPVDMFARGVARIALEKSHDKTVYYARDLRKRNKRSDLRHPAETFEQLLPQETASPDPFTLLDEDLPFGWSPTDKKK